MIPVMRTANGVSVVMPSSTNFATGRSKNEQHGTDNDEYHSKGPQNRDSEESTDQEKYYSRDDHCSSMFIT